MTIREQSRHNEVDIVTKQNRNPSPMPPDQQPARRKGREGEPAPTGPNPISAIVILIPILVLAFLLRSFFVGPTYNEVSYTHFRLLLDGLDYTGSPIVNDAGQRVSNTVRRDSVAQGAKIAQASDEDEAPVDQDPNSTADNSPVVNSVTGSQANMVNVYCNIAEVEWKGAILRAVCHVPVKPEPASDEENWQPMATASEPSKFIKVVLPYSEVREGELAQQLRGHGIRVINREATDNSFFFSMLLTGLTVFMIIGMWYMLRRSQGQMFGGGGFLNSFSRSTAKKFEMDEHAVTFKDVAGADGVKAELEEVVDFLKTPEKYQKLGGRVPKGVLLNGPPGTGKTLLARAVAGEADVPFYSVNGSEFIQMFVGVGASRVRDLFQNAKETAPAIIFVDEIDAVGRQRGAGLGGGHDEREQTLNQILSEMDGFGGNDSVIVVAATNRPDVLDPALLRPGRFDRHITVNRPTRDGRLAIFKVHVRKVPLDENVDLGLLASSTAGMTGADIRNVVNEAALHAARMNKTTVDRYDFSYALDRVRMGPRREEILSEENKVKTAYHEAGHTLTAWLLPKANPVSKVTIIPRGRSLGQTFMNPPEDRLDYSRPEMEQLLIVMLGGRSAENIIYGETSAGAQNDLEQATSLARKMVTLWGMSERLGPVSFKLSDDDPFLGREMHQARQFSEHTMEVIDEEITKILREASRRADEILESNKDKLEIITRGLVEKEELDRIDLIDLIGPAAQPEPKPDEPDGGESSKATGTSADENSSATPEEEKPGLDIGPAANPNDPDVMGESDGN